MPIIQRSLRSIGIKEIRGY